jgi:hypothetical protein
VLLKEKLEESCKRAGFLLFFPAHIFEKPGWLGPFSTQPTCAGLNLKIQLKVKNALQNRD